jgi:hypothetical protein
MSSQIDCETQYKTLRLKDSDVHALLYILRVVGNERLTGVIRGQVDDQLKRNKQNENRNQI